MKKAIIVAMAVLALVSCGNQKKGESKKEVTIAASAYPQDTILANDGSEIILTFYTHASIAIQAKGRQIYIDPVGENIDWAAEPKADLVLITHNHQDHFSVPAIKAVVKPGCNYKKLLPGESYTEFEEEGIFIDAIPAYNTTEDHLKYHPQNRGDAGYLIEVAGKTIYVAGDTEDNEDVLRLSHVDIAFLPVNQPFTMTADQCINVVKKLTPSIFYPYHFGGGDPADLEKLQTELADITDVRIRPLS